MPYKEKGKWRGKVTHRGKRYTGVFTTKKAAMDWESEKRKRLNKEERRSRRGLDLLTFCSRYTIYAERFSKKTHSEKKHTCKRILGHFGKDAIVNDIALDMVEQYLDEQRRHRSSNAANKDRTNLMAMWNKGIKTWGVFHNPWADTDKYRHDRQPQHVPPVEDVLKVLAVATRKERVMLDAFLQTGARRSSIFRLTWHDDINFNDRRIRISHRKSRDGSLVFYWLEMSDELYESLWWLWLNRGKVDNLTDEQNQQLRRAPYVFVCEQPSQNFAKPHTQRRWFMPNLCKKANVEPFGFHSMRRFVASVLDEQRVSLKKIQIILGHSKPTTTDRYIYNLKGDRESMTETMNLLSLKNKKARNPGTHQTKSGGQS